MSTPKPTISPGISPPAEQQLPRHIQRASTFKTYKGNGRAKGNTGPRRTLSNPEDKSTAMSPLHAPSNNIADTPPPPSLLNNKKSPPEEGVIEECSYFYVVLLFLISSFPACLYIYAVAQASSAEDKFYEKVDKFWSWTLLPISIMAIALSFGLKPRREDWKYKSLLYFQCLFFLFADRIARLCFGTLTWYQGLYILIGAALMLLGLKIRSNLAGLPDAEVSEFLTNTLIKEGLLMGLGQLSLLIFSSIQCEGDLAPSSEDWRECNRTLFSQVRYHIRAVCLCTVAQFLLVAAPCRLGLGSSSSSSSP